MENEIQLTDIFKAFVQSFHKHLQQIWTVKHLVKQLARASATFLQAERKASSPGVALLLTQLYELLIEER